LSSPLACAYKHGGWDEEGIECHKQLHEEGKASSRRVKGDRLITVSLFYPKMLLALFCCLCLATVEARDRMYIKRPLPPKVIVGVEGQNGPLVDNGKNHGCWPERPLIEACIVRHPKNTKEVSNECHLESHYPASLRPTNVTATASSRRKDKIRASPKLSRTKPTGESSPNLLFYRGGGKKSRLDATKSSNSTPPNPSLASSAPWDCPKRMKGEDNENNNSDSDTERLAERNTLWKKRGSSSRFPLGVLRRKSLFDEPEEREEE